MSFLLKIVGGPMKGAEIALVDGFRLKVGSGDACDVVIADGSLPEVAFELDVAPESVSMISGGETRTLRPLEVVSVGMTEIAVGPAEGAWGPLVRPEPVAESIPEEAPPLPAETDSAPSAEPASAPEPQVRRRTERRRPGCLFWGVLLILLLLIACGLVWLFWSNLVEACPWAEQARLATVEAMRNNGPGERQPAPASVEKVQPLEEIVRTYGLELGRDGEVPVLRGNVAKRTERLAIRALALAGDREVRFDLTDDETLRAASEELLFVVTEGRLKATAASNRVVTLAGYAPTASALEKAVRALNQDVPGIDRLETKAVRVGGLPPPKAGEERRVFDEPTPEQKSGVARGVKADPAKDLPIAGILTVPYPCVVLRGGMRVAEGAQIGGVTVERIESGRLVLRNGATTFEWKP